VADLLDRLQAALADRYILEIDSADAPRILGRGGMATVYLAQDVKHRRPVALKLLHPDLAQALGAERFLREIEIASQLNHPHILPLYDSGSADGLLYYVMRYVAGESLRQRLTRERQLPVEVAIRLAGEIGRALDYAHQQGVIHRDIKPENILLQDQQALVADFGISRAISGSLKQGAAQKLTETGLTLGTPAYMSPEQASGDRLLDGRSDLYSLGCVVYEMLTGEPPFSGPSAQAILARHVLDPVPPLRTVRSAVPEHAERAVKRALGKVPADRFDNAEDFAQALLTPGPQPVFQPTKVHRRLRLPARPKLALASAVLVAGVATAGMLFSRTAAPTMLDPNLLAVAPFDVLDPGLALWREGLVDYLTKNLDGAGQLRTVAPAVVLQRWKGRADAGSARRLGHRSGARIVVFGNLSPAGRDSVRVRATVLDAGSKTPVAEFEGLDQVDRVDRLADSLTLEVLRGLGRTTTGGPMRLTAVGTRSIPALKAYLQGQQAFRRAAYDSADAHYSRAIALDSTFALALHALASTRGWEGSQDVVLQMRAARFNHGLSPKDSLLILADSLRAAANVPDTAYWTHLNWMIEVARQAGENSGEDPEPWLVYGDLLFHYDYAVAEAYAPFGTSKQVREAFDRAVELDSTFAPAYVHPIELAGNPARARPYVSGYLKAVGPDGGSPGIRLLASLIDPARPNVRRLLDSTDTGVLREVVDLTSTWQDSSETALRLVRLYSARRRPTVGSESWLPGFLAERLAYRGHLKEARAALGDRVGETFAGLALLGAIPPDTASAVAALWYREQVPLPGDPWPAHMDKFSFLVTPPVAIWWAARGDTLGLRALLARTDSGARSADPGTFPRDIATTRATPGFVRATLALARKDTAEALRRVLALPDSAFAQDWSVRLLKFQLLAAVGRDRDAAKVFDGRVLPALSPLWVLGILERGRVAERRGEQAKAIECYQFVVDVWRHADPELQRHVSEAREALERLASG
jgi:tRNA A-37 threonylcarbamoyl transferase component Bud32/tetratricopeptide (TPR) repeat protein